jgi:hypothetical protein
MGAKKIKQQANFADFWRAGPTTGPGADPDRTTSAASTYLGQPAAC